MQHSTRKTCNTTRVRQTSSSEVQSSYYWYRTFHRLSGSQEVDLVHELLRPSRRVPLHERSASHPARGLDQLPRRLWRVDTQGGGLLTRRHGRVLDGTSNTHPQKLGNGIERQRRRRSCSIQSGIFLPFLWLLGMGHESELPGRARLCSPAAETAVPRKTCRDRKWGYFFTSIDDTREEGLEVPNSGVQGIQRNAAPCFSCCIFCHVVTIFIHDMDIVGMSVRFLGRTSSSSSFLEPAGDGGRPPTQQRREVEGGQEEGT